MSHLWVIEPFFKKWLINVIKSYNAGFWEHRAPRVVGFRCRILDNGLFILNLSGSCGSVMTHLSPTGEWFTHSSLLSHSNSLRETWEGAKYISLILVATMFIVFQLKKDLFTLIIGVRQFSIRIKGKFHFLIRNSISTSK